MTTARIHVLLLAVVQAVALVFAALSGERWAILPAAASIAIAVHAAWSLRRERAERPSERATSYREAARREEDTTVVATPRPARKRVLREEYAEAHDAAFALCAGAGVCGGCGLLLAVFGWRLRDQGVLMLCAAFTVAGFVLLACWARCRSTVGAWRDQERERGER